MTRRRTRANGGGEAAAGLARLWAPWRTAYVGKVRRAAPRCIFCFGRLSEPSRRQRLVLHAGPLAAVMLNRYPYNNGHLMVAPRRHVASLELLPREERATLFEVMAFTVERLRQNFHPEGINVGANLGRSAGAGFADHMHWHLVPRWNGDTNFMPVLAATKVISQSLEETFDLLAPHFKAFETALS